MLQLNFNRASKGVIKSDTATENIFGIFGRCFDRRCVQNKTSVVAAIEMMQTTNGAESLYLFNSATTDKCGHCYKITLFSGMGIVVSVVHEIPLCI